MPSAHSPPSPSHSTQPVPPELTAAVPLSCRCVPAGCMEPRVQRVEPQAARRSVRRAGGRVDHLPLRLCCRQCHLCHSNDASAAQPWLARRGSCDVASLAASWFLCRSATSGAPSHCAAPVLVAGVRHNAMCHGLPCHSRSMARFCARV